MYYSFFILTAIKFCIIYTCYRIFFISFHFFGVMFLTLYYYIYIMCVIYSMTIAGLYDLLKLTTSTASGYGTVLIGEKCKDIPYIIRTLSPSSSTSHSSHSKYNNSAIPATSTIPTSNASTTANMTPTPTTTTTATSAATPTASTTPITDLYQGYYDETEYSDTYKGEENMTIDLLRNDITLVWPSAIDGFSIGHRVDAYDHKGAWCAGKLNYIYYRIQCILRYLLLYLLFLCIIV